MNKRLEYIDLAKGIAIFLMVIGHSIEGGSIKTYIYSFHMPLFFILSGMLYRFHNIEKGTISFNIRKKVNTLLWPYIFWSITYQLFSTILATLHGENFFLILEENFMSVIQLNGGVYWFLPCMFISTSIFLFLYNKLFSGLIFACLYVLGLLFPQTPEIMEALLRSIIATFFIFFGYYAYNYLKKTVHPNILLIIFALNILTSQINGEVGLAGRVSKNPILFTINAIVGSYIIIQLSLKASSKNNIFVNLIQLWGKNSLKILCVHLFIVEIINAIDSKFLNSTLAGLGFFKGIFVACLTMLIITILLPLINKLLWWTFSIKINK